MKKVRALCILFVGDSISKKGLDQIANVVKFDNSANGQSLTTVEFESDEICKLLADTARRTVEKLPSLSKLEKACYIIGEKFNAETFNPIELVAAYITDNEVRDAMIEISNAPLELLINSAAANVNKITSRRLYNAIKKIIEEIKPL